VFLRRNLLFVSCPNLSVYVEIKCQLDATEVFIADLIACSTSILQTGRITLSSTPDQLLEKPQQKIPHAATTVYTLELLMMGIVMPETC